MKKKLLVGTICTSFLLGMVGLANAIPVYYTDESAFLAAAGTLNFESFESSPTTTSDTYVFDDFTVSETGGIDILTNVAINNSFGSTPVTDGENAIWYDDNGSSIGTFFDFDTPISAFGLDITTSSASTISLGGSVSSSLSLAANTPTFWGVIDTDSFLASLSFSASGGPLVGFDSVQYGGTAPVPEPATLLLFGAGLVGLASVKRRKK